ncbi:MAG TPA: tetratricopeptide repeat protein, partial [Thermoanaerobaculia bacterium]|nr:tetratricopeptide repeat protein [Thermoanaerobaculia bacterium]
LLKLAVEADPDSTRAQAALASAWLTLGYDREGRESAKRALDLATGLPREEVLFAEARYREAAKEWDRAIEAYRTLFDFYPDNIEYGLALANVQSSARKGRDALATVERLRAMSNDPRVDLAEAEAARTISDFVRQREAAKRAIRKAEAVGAKLVIARGYAAIATADRNTNAPESSMANARRALALFQERGDLAGVAAAQNGIASVEFDRGHLTTAREWWEKMLVTSRTTGDRFGIARGLNNTALAMLHQGDLAGAEPRYRETLGIARAIGDNTTIARALNNLAEVPYLRGELDRALALDEESLAVAKSAGDRSLVANVIFDIGDVELARGNLKEARARHDEALAMRRAIGDLGTSNESLLSLGEIALAENNAREAERLAREVGAATKGKRRDNERASLVLLARALLAQNRRGEAEPVVRAAVAAARDSENARVRLSTEVLEAQFARDRGKLESIAREAEKMGLRLLARDARAVR